MIIKHGSTDVTTYFVLRDSTNHLPKTDVIVTDLDLYYVIEKSAISAKVDASALAAADSDHIDNSAFNVGQGVYRIDWPDIWSGGIGTKVILIVVCSGVDTVFLEAELSPASNVVAYGGSAGIFSGGRPEVNTTHIAGSAVNTSSAQLGVNVVQISGDSTAADNAESFFDGTGYAGTNNVIPTVTSITDVNAIADAFLDRSSGIETDLTPRQFARLLASLLLSKAFGLESGIETYRDYNDTKNRLVATVSAGTRIPTIRDAT